MSYTYTYLKNEEDFENQMPFNYKAFDEYIEKYPNIYPCILKFSDDSSNEAGYSFDIEIIEDISEFIFENGCLYKLDRSDFILRDGSLYKKC